jgi:protein O-mannosyl-transferase
MTKRKRETSQTPSAPLAPEERGSILFVITAGTAVFLATLVVYWPALGGSLLWDDDAYVTAPALRSFSGLMRIWFDLGATEQYYPILHSAFWVEHGLWGDAAVGYHLINVALHATAACLFARVLLRLDQKMEIAWLAAFIFALHPVCVESVAWISEQKNTLSTVFYLWSALAYLRFDRDRGQGSYLLALGLFVLALLSKTVTATLPAALLVVLWWQQGRLSWRRDVAPLLPWFGLGAAAGLFSGWVERTYVGAQGASFSLSFLQRCLVAGREIWFYLGKLLWPANLIFIYPHWSVDAGAPLQWVFPFGAIALLAALWLIRRRTRAPLAALLLFVGTLFPTLGFFNIYAFLFSYVADHWQYLASLGIIALAAAGWGYLPRLPARIGAGVLLAGMGVLSWEQCRMYDNVETFYRTILDRNPAAWMAHDNLGVVLARSGRLSEAITHYQEALRFKPDSAEIYHDLGTAMTQAGRLPEAIADFEQALRLQPGYAAAHYHLGSVFARLGRMEEAVGQFEQALQAKPDDAEAQNNLGSALAMLNRMPEATEHFAAAVRLDPDSAQARCNLGKALAQQGRIPEAIEQFRAALRLNPDMTEAREILRQLQGSAFPQN